MKIISESAIDGGKRIDFIFEDRECIICVPEKPRDDRRWFWRPQFFEAFDFCDIAMFKKGYFRVFIDMPDMYGSKNAIEIMKKFHDFIVSEYSLYPKALIFGISRGGLYSANYAAKYPDDVSALYLDAPVMNILSWPFGCGKHQGSPIDMEKALAEFGISEAEILSYRENPIDKTEALAKADIPIMFVCGLADTVVPFDENTEVFIKKYKELGGNYELITKPDCGHHPHSLEDPTPIIQYLEKHGK